MPPLLVGTDVQKLSGMIRGVVNSPDSQTAATVLTRMAPGLVGFLHFFTLGAALPLFPLYLRNSLGVSWTIAGIILTAIPFSLLIGQVCVRTLSNVGIDVRPGLSMSHLLAAGVAMATAFRAKLPVDWTPGWLSVFGLTVLYFSLLSPSMIWFARIGDASSESGRSMIRSWRVWGTVGFIAPAWLCESVLIRIPDLEAAIESFEILFQMAAWAGLATAFSAILLPECDSRSADSADLSNEDSQFSERLGLGLACGVVLMVLVQRCHYVWNAPFFESVIQKYSLGTQLVFRLVVADQVFQLFGLMLLGYGVQKFGTRTMFATGALSWSGRSLLLAWIAQAETSIQSEMLCLGAAQILQGAATVAFFGTLGVVLRLHRGVDGCRYQIMLVSVCGILAVLIGGCFADAMLDRDLVPEVQGPLHRLELESAGRFSFDSWFQGWAGVWCLSAIPSLLAVALVSSSKSASLSPDQG